MCTAINLDYSSFSSLGYSEISFLWGFLALFFNDLLLTLCLVIKLVSSWQTGINSLLQTWSASLAPLKNSQQTCCSPCRFQERAGVQDSIDVPCCQVPRSCALHRLFTRQCVFARQYQSMLTIMLMMSNCKSSADNQWCPKAWWAWISGN